MFLWGNKEDGTSLEEQWGMVGDIFLVGCQIPDTVVFPEFNKYNPDMTNPRFNTPTGMYEANCGLDNCLKAWGHDEYLWEVLNHHPGNKIPEEGMVMIRYHSFYPWHTGGSYRELMAPKDFQYLEWVKRFNRYDLYTKALVTLDEKEMKAIYQPLLDKYLGAGPVFF